MSDAALEGNAVVAGIFCEICLKEIIRGRIWDAGRIGLGPSVLWVCDDCRERILNATPAQVDAL